MPLGLQDFNTFQTMGKEFTGNHEHLQWSEVQIPWYDEICPVEWHDSAMRSLLRGVAPLG